MYNKKTLVHLLYSGQGGLGTYFMNFVLSDKNQHFEHIAIFYGIEALHPEYKQFCIDHNLQYHFFKRQSKFDFKNLLNIRGKIKTLPRATTWVLFHSFSLTPLLFITPGYKSLAFNHTSAPFKSRLETIYGYLHILFSRLVFFYEGHALDAFKSDFWRRRVSNEVIIPKVVDTDVFKPATAEIEKTNTLNIGMASRFTKGKLQDLLIELVASESIPKEFSINLHFAGGGNFEDACKSLAERKSITGKVKFHGVLDRKDLVTFYHGLDIYIHASLGETICYAIMEAQACGLPVLASNVKGINNSIEEGKEGYLFENNIESIVNGLNKISSLDKRIEIGKQARAKAVNLTDRFNNADLLYEVLHQKH